MDNRFVQLSQELRQLEQLRAKAGRTAGSLSIEKSARSKSPFGRTLSASQRALVVLLENGGIDLKIGELVKQIPGYSLLPDSAVQLLANALNEAIRKLTDDLLEGAELALNRYTAAKPDHFGEVVVLRNQTAMLGSLRDTLIRLTSEGKTIDLLVLTHGNEDLIAAFDGAEIRSADIRGIRQANGGKPIRLRSVYMMNCHGATLNQAWLDIGAKASAGSTRNNYLPEPTTYFFFVSWKAGRSFNDSVTNAYRSTVDLMKTVISDAVRLVVPGFIADQIVDRIVDLPNRQFVRDSAPVLAGTTTVTINSDDLSFAQVARGFSYTVVPLAHGMQAAPRTRGWSVSNNAIEFIKSFESFRANLYNDPANHCSIGYGTLVHLGPCDGRASEALYKSGITRERAVELMRTSLNDFERVINDVVQVELEPHQYDALVSFAYNVGPTNFRGSTLLRHLNAGNFDEVPLEMMKWVRAAGKEMPGLVRRRRGEAVMFRESVYPATTQSMRAVRAFGEPDDAGARPYAGVDEQPTNVAPDGTGAAGDTADVQIGETRGDAANASGTTLKSSDGSSDAPSPNQSVPAAEPPAPISKLSPDGNATIMLNGNSVPLTIGAKAADGSAIVFRRWDSKDWPVGLYHTPAVALTADELKRRKTNIVLHETVSFRGMTRAEVHFFIDWDGVIYQCADTGRSPLGHASDTHLNLFSIGIEFANVPFDYDKTTNPVEVRGEDGSLVVISEADTYSRQRLASHSWRAGGMQNWRPVLPRTQQLESLVWLLQTLVDASATGDAAWNLGIEKAWRNIWPHGAAAAASTSTAPPQEVAQLNASARYAILQSNLEIGPRPLGRKHERPMSKSGILTHSVVATDRSDGVPELLYTWLRMEKGMQPAAAMTEVERIISAPRGTGTDADGSSPTVVSTDAMVKAILWPEVMENNQYGSVTIVRLPPSLW